MSEPMYECPRFNRCAVNRCPLSVNYVKQDTHPDDREKKCKLPKDKRLEIAARYPPGTLPYDGRSGRENAAMGRPLHPALAANKYPSG